MASSASIRQREVPGFLPEIGMGYQEEWLKMQDGTSFDGMNFLTLFRNGNSPFVEAWDGNLLIQERGKFAQITTWAEIQVITSFQS